MLPQRYKFSSKSQLNGIDVTISPVVVATAKVQIFKQITTGNRVNDVDRLLLLLPQRYKFSSKSQRRHIWHKAAPRCCCYRKGTNFQANHNKSRRSVCFLSLLLLPQRYKFSSKSQPTRSGESKPYRCCCYRKGTNFQANHNRLGGLSPRHRVVVATAKVQIFKQITTQL